MTTIAQSTDTPSRLVAKNLTLGYGDRIIVDGLDLEIPTGVITTVIGPMVAASRRSCVRSVVCSSPRADRLSWTARRSVR